MGAVATRKAFGDAILRLGEDPRVVVLTGDLKNSTHTEDFEAKYPERFVDVGIAESNMIGVAAGLALSGKVPFACSFSAFITGRQETIRVSVGYNEANVRIVGTHVGIGIGEDGATQMAMEDVAAMRALPNMAIIQPCDEVETHRAVEYLLDHQGPAFLRLTRQGVPAIHGDDYTFRFGEPDVLREGSDVVLVATGAQVAEALGAADALATEGVSAGVVNVHTLQPFGSASIVERARATGRVVTAEDHNVNGGLGSAVAEALAEAGAGARQVRVGLRGYGESGTTAELYAARGLDAAGIATAARALLDR
ncbi:MAG TPA: transketolase C-terminal domain-containing protein [Actinomycetota bacterium]